MTQPTEAQQKVAKEIAERFFKGASPEPLAELALSMLMDAITKALIIQAEDAQQEKAIVKQAANGLADQLAEAQQENETSTKLYRDVQREALVLGRLLAEAQQVLTEARKESEWRGEKLQSVAKLAARTALLEAAEDAEERSKHGGMPTWHWIIQWLTARAGVTEIPLTEAADWDIGGKIIKKHPDGSWTIDARDGNRRRVQFLCFDCGRRAEGKT